MKGGLLTLLSLPLLFVGSTTIQSNICETPVTPVIVTPAANSTLSSQTTIMSGTTTASSTVTITDNSQPAASVMSDVNGDFAVQLTLTVGQNQLTAQASNPCGTSGTASESVTVTLPVVPLSPSLPGHGSGSGSSSTTSGSTGHGKTAPSSSSTSTSTTSPPLTTTPLAAALSVSITTPANHLTTSKDSVFVSGFTNIPAVEVITVNGVKEATLYSTGNSFGASVPLELGNNTIQVTITANGKTATARVNVTRIHSQPIIVPWYDATCGRIGIALGILLLLIIILLLFIRRKRKKQEQPL